MEKGKKNKKQEVHMRKKYMQYTSKLLEWVDNLGFEQTMFGQMAQKFEERFYLRKVTFLFLYGLILSFVLFLDLDFTQNFNVGDLATTDVKSPLSFQIIDEVATEAKKVDAENGTLPVFDYDPDSFEAVFDRIYNSFSKMREHPEIVNWPRSEAKREEKVKNFVKYKPEFEDMIGIELTKREFEWLVTKRFQVGVENSLMRALEKWSNLMLFDNQKKVLRPEDEQIIIHQLGEGEEKEKVIDLSAVRDLRNRSDFSLKGVRLSKYFSKKDKIVFKRIAHSMIVPNITFNKKETTERRQQARASVLPVQISIQKNQTIVSAGSKIQPIHLTILNEIKDLKSDRRTDFVSLITAILFVTLILVLFSYMRRFSLNKIVVETKDVLVMGLIAVLIAATTKIFIFMTDASFVTKFGELIPSSVFLYAAPFAAGPMLAGLLITSGEIVWIFTVFLSIVLGVMVEMDFNFLVVALIGGIAAARGVFGCEKRNDIYLAGLRAGGVNALLIAVLITMDNQYTGQVGHQLIWNVPAGIVGGVFSSFVAMMLVPLLETAFNYTTDVKLLELSNLNHPLMKQMMVKAPGTYHHSLAVGTMAEEAAGIIGASPLLAKVMGYYHDIGKMEHAQYFAENQRPGYNPHDHISPFMSKTILIAHVKDGAELGLKYNLGKPIIDGILQHHGTTLISYFYNKAVSESSDNKDNIEENDFRYPGPKPQFKESALVMLADSIEAAARSMDEPTSARLTHLVENIIESKFIDGQLNECNLTLTELSVIENAFKKTLLSIYHQRIDYPHMNLGAPVKDDGKNGKKKGLHSVGNT